MGADLRRSPTRSRPVGISIRALTCALFVSSLPASSAVNAEGENGETAPPPLFPITSESSGAEPGSTDPQLGPLAPQQEVPRGAEEVIETRVTYAISDGIFVDAGSETTLAEGRIGWLEVNGARIARIEVGQVASNSWFIRITPDPTLVFPRDGQRVRLILEPLRRERVVPEEPTTLREDRDAPPAPFEPLLGPYVVDAETRNLFHGRAGIRQYLEITSNGLEDSYRTIFDTAGSVERLGGTPWSLEWSLDAIYRGGEALDQQEHFEEVFPEVRRLSLVRRFDDRSILRVGRFLPVELASVGTLDGIHSELVLGPYLRVGGMLGLRPDRDDLSPSGKEPTLATYATFYWEEDDRAKTYSATSGALLSLYEGDTDRLAFFLDQHARVGRWTLFSTSEIDFDTGSSIASEGVRLTRWDISSNYVLGSTIFHAGVNHFGIPDTAAERDQLLLETTTASAFFEDDSWRATLGATHQLTRTISIEEELSFIDSDASDDQLLWSVGISKREWLTRGSSLTARVYQLGGEDIDGYGGSITGYFPFRDSRLALMPSLSARMSNFDEPEGDLEVGDIGLRVLWRFTDNCSLTSGAIFTDADDINRVRFDLGLTVRW